MTYASVNPVDLAITLYNHAGTQVTICDDYDNLSAKRMEWGDGVAQFTLPITPTSHSLQFTSAGYTSALSGYRAIVTYRASTFFDGCVVICDDDDLADGGTNYNDIPAVAKIEAWAWPRWLLSGRLIMGTGRDRFTQSSKTPDDILRQLWRVNCVAGSIIEPTEYATLYDPTTGGGPYTISRGDFHPYTVAVEVDSTSHPDTVTHRWDHSRSLWDNSLEFCRQYNMRMTASVSGTTVTLGVVYPAVTDKSATIRFTRAMGNLLRFGRHVDRGRVSNVAECRGQGRRAGQIAAYACHKASIDDMGVRETAEVWRSADVTDAANDAEAIIHQVGGAATVHVAKLAELDNQHWGLAAADFDIHQKVTIYDAKRSLTVTDAIAELELRHQAGSVPELNIMACIPPLNEDKKGGRSGGGHGGGHARAGGHPKNTDGEFGNESFTRCHNNGVSITVTDTDGVVGETNARGVGRVYSRGVVAIPGSGLEVVVTPVEVEATSNPTHKIEWVGDDGNLYIDYVVQSTGAGNPTFECGGQ